MKVRFLKCTHLMIIPSLHNNFRLTNIIKSSSNMDCFITIILQLEQNTKPNIKVPLKRNFRMWDFCLIIKFEPYLETLPTFFFACSERKLLFQQFEVDRLSLKLAAILARPKQRCDVTGCITLLPRWKFRVIMGEETSVRSPRKHSLGQLRAVKQLVNNSSLRPWRG